MAKTLVMLALVTVGCSYEYGARRRDTAVLTGIGWDSGIAYGDAMASARQLDARGEPDYVSASCWLVPLKAFMGVGLLSGLALTKPTSVVFIPVAAAVFAVAFVIPNCTAEVGFNTTADPSPPPRTRRQVGPIPAPAPVIVAPPEGAGEVDPESPK